MHSVPGYNGLKALIGFLVERPKQTLAFAGILTGFCMAGLARLQMDASMEALMPEHDASYLMLKRAREVYGNRKTLIITSLEGSDGPEILTKRNLRLMSDIVDELREFQDGDPQEQEARYAVLLRNARARSYEAETVVGTETFIKAAESDTIEDAFFLDGEKENASHLSQSTTDYWDIGDFSSLKPEQRHAPHNEDKRSPVFDDYKPLSLKSLSQGLSDGGLRDLQTVACRLNLNDWNQPLTQAQTTSVLNLMHQIGRLKKQRIVREIIDPIRGEDMVAEGNTLSVRPFLPREKGHTRIPENDDEMAAYMERLKRNPIAESGIYAADSEGNIKALAIATLLRNEGDYAAFVDHYLSLMQRREIKTTSVGDLILDRALNQANQKDMGLYLPLSVFMIVFTIWISFRSLRVTALISAAVLTGTVWTLGTMGWLGVPLTITGSLLPPILITVASSYGIHICNRFLVDIQDQRPDVVKQSVLAILPTVLLAALTTIFGFVALSLNEVQALREFGLFAALGTFYAVLAAILILPAALTLMPGLQIRLKTTTGFAARAVSRYLITVNDAVQKRPFLIVSSFFVTVIICSFGVYNLKTDEAPLSYFPEDANVRTEFLHVDSLFRGSYSIDLEFDSHREGGVHSPGFLAEMEDVREFIESHPRRKDMMILKTVSYTDFDRRMHMAMNGDDRDHYRIPGSEELIRGYHEIFSGKDDNADGRPDVMESYVDPLYRRAILTLRIGEIENRSVSTENAALIRKILLPEIAHRLKGSETTVRMTGLLNAYETLKHYVVSGNIRGIGLSALLIATVVFLVYRNGEAALLSLLPILVSVWIVYALMGFLGIPLDTVKAILSSIAIGIGVDDTVHFLRHYIAEKRRTGCAATAVEITLRECGSAIVFTTLALVAGFAVTLLSSFSPVVHLGFLIIAVMLTTTISALYLLPATILLIERTRKGGFHASLFLSLILGIVVLPFPVAATPLEEGYRHMRVHKSLPEPVTAVMKSALVIKRGDRTEVKEFEVYSLKQTGETRTRMVFSSPSKIDFLSHSRPGKDDDQWIKLASTGVRRIAAGDRGASFVNSHFSYADIAAQSLDDSTYELIGMQKVDDEKCFKIRAIRKANRVYSHTDLYLRVADHVMIRAEYYENGRHTKTMRLEKIEFFKGIPTPRKITMERTDGSGRTILYVRSVEYDTPLSDGLFTHTGL